MLPAASILTVLCAESMPTVPVTACVLGKLLTPTVPDTCWVAGRFPTFTVPVTGHGVLPAAP
jgi:hypothetical protein